MANSRPGIALARRGIRRVGSLSEGVSIAPVCQWLDWDMVMWTCACAVNPLSVFLFIVLVMCSTPIWVALSLIRGSPRPASLSRRWTPSVGKFGSSPMGCRIALLSIPSMVISWRSLKTPRWVA